VAELHSALDDPELRIEVLERVRGLIERVELHPAEGGFRIELVGEIANMIEALRRGRRCGEFRVGDGSGFGNGGCGDTQLP
jgi:hypothetical protein